MYDRLIIVKGASGRKVWFFFVNPSEDQLSLLEFLRSKGLGIASSCDGEGICKKCQASSGLITCQKTCKEYLDDKNRHNDKTPEFIEFFYL